MSQNIRTEYYTVLPWIEVIFFAEKSIRETHIIHARQSWYLRNIRFMPSGLTPYSIYILSAAFSPNLRYIIKLRSLRV